MYKGEVVHIVGTLSSYLGELGQEEHPNGKNWMRINNPVAMKYEGDQIKLLKLGGVEDLYKPYVDIKLPADVAYEVRVLDKASMLYDGYIKESRRKKPSLIVTPQAAGLKAVLR